MIEIKIFILTGSEAFLLVPIMQWSVLTEDDCIRDYLGWISVAGNLSAAIQYNIEVE